MVPPFHWVLFTLILSLGTFGSEGKKFQQDTGETPRWLPLSADPTPGAEEASELTNAREDHLTPGFVDQKQKTKKTGDFVQQKRDEDDDILKRRHGFYQVDIQPIYSLIRRCQIELHVESGSKNLSSTA